MPAGYNVAPGLVFGKLQQRIAELELSNAVVSAAFDDLSAQLEQARSELAQARSELAQAGSSRKETPPAAPRKARRTPGPAVLPQDVPAGGKEQS